MVKYKLLDKQKEFIEIPHSESLDVAIYILFSGLTASIGNYALQNSNTASEELFKKITFINYPPIVPKVTCMESWILY